MVNEQAQESEATSTDETNRPWWVGWVMVAAAAVIVVIAAVALFDGTDDNTQIDVVDEDGAVAVSGDYIHAFNSGDADAVLALLTPDVALSEKYTGMSDSFEPLDRPFFEQHLAWSTAQGTAFVSPECSAADATSGAAINVSCEFGWLYAAEKAAGASPVSTKLSLVVTTEGISELAFEYPPAFGVASFDIWLFVNHEDDSQGVEFGDWTSVDEARQGGTLRAQYVAEWAAEVG
jgi:hypothetical protein